jgi:hypothetical protein
MEDALVDSAFSDAAIGDAGYESILVASDSSVLIVELLSSATVESSAFAISVNIAKVSWISCGVPCGTPGFRLGDVARVVAEVVDLGADSEGDVVAGALSCFFRNSIAFISLAFSGVIVGTLVVAVDFVEIVDRMETPELVFGRPLLVWDCEG